jgi:HD-like signal output (HDOD) protein
MIMKTTICFSGFTGDEAAALQAETGKLNPQWECWMAPDADGTLKLLKGNPCDVLVVNMPGLAASAVELLKETASVSHKLFRFIVGDVDDQSQVINSIGGSHQFIRRPVEAKDLVKNIQRGLKVDAWLSTDELRALVPRLRRLPSLPSTYFNLLKETESPSATLQGIAAIIARDPVVTARLLQMVNSAAFSLSEKVTNPTEAVGLLGVQTIKSLTLCLQVYGQKDEAREAGLSLEVLWEHSLLVAKFARTITLKQTGDDKLADEAFTVGLLHDLGRIVMATNMPREYAAAVTAAREKSSPLHEQETAQFGVNHAKVGAYLLGLWGLPAQYIEATAAHHAPGQTAFSNEFSLLSAVHAANVFAHEMGGQTDGLPQPQLDLAYYQTLQLDDQLAIWRRACTGESTPENASATPAPRAERQPRQAKPVTQPKVQPARNISFWLKFVTALISLSAGSLLRLVRPKPTHPAKEE